MKAVLRLFPVFVFLVGGAVLWLNQSAAAENSVFEKNYLKAGKSRSLYLNNCARCHGADGKGLTETGKLYDVPDISGGRLRRSSNKRLTNVITKGGGSMPAFGKKLTKAQIASLVGYVRSL